VINDDCMCAYRHGLDQTFVTGRHVINQGYELAIQRHRFNLEMRTK
jgi:hypothetical protein